MRKSIAFFGLYGSFNFHKIGGVDALVRRLSLYLVDSGYNVVLINYNAPDNTEVKSINERLTIIERKNLNGALEYLDQHNIHKVLCTYLRLKDKVVLRKFKSRYPRIDFSLLLTVYHDNSLKRELAYIESAWNPAFKNIYCISHRILNSVSKYTSKAKLLLPPVDDDFYLDSVRVSYRKFRISYMGRLDQGKGADIVIDFFKNSGLDRNKFEFYIYSYPWKSDAESMAMHNYLSSQDNITYIESKVKYYSKEVDINLRKIIDDTHLFILPYRTLSSTIDTPLVPLEIISRKKLFLSTNVGTMSSLVTDKRFILDSINNEELDSKVLEVYDNYETLISEIGLKSKELSYETSVVAKKLLESI